MIDDVICGTSDLFRNQTLLENRDISAGSGLLIRVNFLII